MPFELIPNIVVGLGTHRDNSFYIILVGTATSMQKEEVRVGELRHEMDPYA